MHILDFIMYFVTAVIIWWIMDKVTYGNWTNELGGLFGMFIMIIYTVIYIIVFCFWSDLNWIDIFKGVYNVELSNLFKW